MHHFIRKIHSNNPLLNNSIFTNESITKQLNLITLVNKNDAKFSGIEINHFSISIDEVDTKKVNHENKKIIIIKSK